jgi:hypothetical protein
MGLQQIFAFLIRVFFSIGMIGTYWNAFLFPVETDYWLVRSGFLILFLEILCLYVLTKPVTPSTLKKMEFLKLPKKQRIAQKLGFLMLLSGVLALIFQNALVFGYFLITASLKAYSVLKGDKPLIVMNKKNFGILILAILFLIPPFLIIGAFFPVQTELLQNEFARISSERNGTSSGLIVESPALIVGFAVGYYILLIVAEIIAGYKSESRTPHKHV